MILLRDGDARVEIEPARGGMVTRFAVADTPILAMDEATLADPAKNVRGGIPILFPIAGRVSGDAWRGRPLSQHGFARNLPWRVAHSDAQSATLILDSSTETRARFDFDFQLEFVYRVSGPSLRIDQRYANRSAEPMPLHAGFHPYFFVPDGEKGETRIATPATRAFDNVTKQDVALASPIDLTKPEVDLHLHDHGAPTSAIDRPGAPRITLRASPEFSQWVIWTLAGRDFVCVEPWSAPANALHTGDHLLWIAPGETRALWLEIALGA